MSTGNDMELRATLAKFGGTNLGDYACIALGLTFFVYLFFEWISLSQFMLLVIVLLNLPCCLLVVAHVIMILRSIGKAARMTKDPSLSGSVKYFVGSVAILLIFPATVILLFFVLNWDLYSGLIGRIGYLIFFGILPAYFFVTQKALALIWVWVSGYDGDGSGERGALELIENHPRGRLMGLAFKAFFGEGEIRARAAVKLAYNTTYPVEPEQDEGDEENEEIEEDEADHEIKRLAHAIDPIKQTALEIAPQKVPLRPRDIKDGRCPNCGAPVTSPNPRYCTKCGETFKGSW